MVCFGVYDDFLVFWCFQVSKCDSFVFASFFRRLDRIWRLPPGFVVPMPVMGCGIFRGSEEEEMLLLYASFFNLNIVELYEAQQLPYRYHSTSLIFSAVVTVDTKSVMYLQPKYT